MVSYGIHCKEEALRFQMKPYMGRYYMEDYVNEAYIFFLLFWGDFRVTFFFFIKTFWVLYQHGDLFFPSSLE